MPLRPLALFIATTLFTPVYADFNTAMTAYEAKQFERAFVEFKRLAELGDLASQRDLAAMYARGEHVEKNLIEAWAWASLAAEQGDPSVKQLVAALTGKLTDAQRQLAQDRLLALQSQFGTDALAGKLMPIASDRVADCTVSGTGPAIPLKTQAPKYPEAALQSGANGSVCLRFYIDPNGLPKRLSVYEIKIPGAQEDSRFYRSLAKQFGDSTKTAISKWQFLPPLENRMRESPAKYCMDYRITGAGSGVYVTSKENKLMIEKLLPLAQAGHATAQYDLATLFRSALTTNSEQKRTDLQNKKEKLFLQSAINGDGRGQYYLASRLLTGNQCEKDAKKGLFWLTLAAQQGNAEAAWLMSQRTGEGLTVVQDKDKARQWLKIAAEGGHPRAMVQYAQALLEHDPAQLDQAASLLPELATDSDDIALLEAHATVAALRGDFVRAAQLQQLVVAIATELQFTLSARQQALAAYQQQQLPAVAPVVVPVVVPVIEPTATPTQASL